MSEMANKLIHRGYLKTDSIIDAFSEINRAEFVSDKFRVAALSDIPLSIGFGQTSPEPSVVSFMLELLRPGKGHSVLVVGYGGGWIITMLAFIVGSDGHVTAIDTINELKSNTEENIAKYNFTTRDRIVNLKLISTPEDIDSTARYDRILVINPLLWGFYNYYDLLKVEGVMVAPIDNVIYYFNNRGSDEENIEERFDSMKFLPV